MQAEQEEHEQQQRPQVGSVRAAILRGPAVFGLRRQAQGMRLALRRGSPLVWLAWRASLSLLPRLASAAGWGLHPALEIGALSDPSPPSVLSGHGRQRARLSRP